MLDKELEDKLELEKILESIQKLSEQINVSVSDILLHLENNFNDLYPILLQTMLMKMNSKK